MSEDSFKVPSLPVAKPAPKPPTEAPTVEPKPIKKKETEKPQADLPLKYEEPEWSSEPPAGYSIEVIKNGSIVETIPLKNGKHSKNFFLVGRFTNCDIIMEHPSLSRHHAVLQYRGESESSEEPKGFYLYDLESSHGSYHNKKRCFSKKFYPLRVGHALKFGGSTRMLILQGPEEDMEDESELSVTELQSIARQKKEEEELEAVRMKKEEEERKAKEEEEERKRGISWGMGDDAIDEDEEHPDMTKNPFARVDHENESKYSSDPKKALRAWFEREGLDEPEYKVVEEGYAKFSCVVELPVDSSDGRALVAEVTVQGKKKEAIAQCALEACRMLDRHGFFSSSGAHEAAHKKRLKELEDNDFYASDEDDYLDRTGAIERKRKMRMKMAGKDQEEEQKPETYESLKEKLSNVMKEIDKVEKEIEYARGSKSKDSKSVDYNDDLDSFMDDLKKTGAMDKVTVSKLKFKLHDLRASEAKLNKLIEVARPTHLPSLKSSKESVSVGATQKPAKSVVVIGKRSGGVGALKAVQVDRKEKTKPEIMPNKMETENPPKTIEDDIKSNQTESKPLPPPQSEQVKPGEQEEAPKKKSISRTKEDKQKADSVGKVVMQLGDSRKRKIEHVENVDRTEYEKEAFKYDESDPKYAMWVPPTEQTGDGRTSLNDKLGY